VLTTVVIKVRKVAAAKGFSTRFETLLCERASGHAFALRTKGRGPEDLWRSTRVEMVDISVEDGRRWPFSSRPGTAWSWSHHGRGISGCHMSPGTTQDPPRSISIVHTEEYFSVMMRSPGPSNKPPTAPSARGHDNEVSIIA
jgi:hypothetical protein